MELKRSTFSLLVAATVVAFSAQPVAALCHRCSMVTGCCIFAEQSGSLTCSCPNGVCTPEGACNIAGGGEKEGGFTESTGSTLPVAVYAYFITPSFATAQALLSEGPALGDLNRGSGSRTIVRDLAKLSGSQEEDFALSGSAIFMGTLEGQRAIVTPSGDGIVFGMNGDGGGAAIGVQWLANGRRLEPEMTIDLQGSSVFLAPMDIDGRRRILAVHAAQRGRVALADKGSSSRDFEALLISIGQDQLGLENTPIPLQVAALSAPTSVRARTWGEVKSFYR